MRKRGRVDANQPDIVAAFRKAGASVQHLSDVGGGCTDLVIGYLGHSVLVEIKDGSKPPSEQKLTPDQERFHRDWKGAIAVVRNEQEAGGLIAAIHDHVSMLNRAGMCGHRWLKTGSPWEEGNE